MRMKKALVTGGAGFIGSNIASALLKLKVQVIVLDNLSTGYLQNVQTDENALFIQGDVRDDLTALQALRGIDTIFHLAASVGNRRSFLDPMADSEVNVLGTLRVMEAAKHFSVSKIVYSSSAGIFGELKTLPIREDHPLDPDSYYGVSKLAAEKHLWAFHKMTGVSVVCLRYFNAYGRNQRYDAYGNVIPIFADRIVKREKLIIYGDGEQTRDFINVDDVVTANLIAATSDRSGIYNTSSGEAITINKLAEMMQETDEARVGVEYAAPRIGDVRHSRADVSAIGRELGFQPQVSLKEGLRDYMQWLRQDPISLDRIAEQSGE